MDDDLLIRDRIRVRESGIEQDLACNLTANKKRIIPCLESNNGRQIPAGRFAADEETFRKIRRKIINLRSSLQKGT